MIRCRGADCDQRFPTESERDEHELAARHWDDPPSHRPERLEFVDAADPEEGVAALLRAGQSRLDGLVIAGVRDELFAIARSCRGGGVRPPMQFIAATATDCAMRLEELLPDGLKRRAASVAVESDRGETNVELPTDCVTPWRGERNQGK